MDGVVIGRRGPNHLARGAYPFGMAVERTGPSEVQAAIDREVSPGEPVIWAGQPEAWSLVRPLAPMSLMGALGFALTVFLLAFSGGTAPWPLVWLVGALFLVVTAGLVLSPLLMRLEERQTAYILTDRRAIVCEGRVVGSSGARSYWSRGLRIVECRQRRGGRGDVVFERYEREAPGEFGKEISRFGFLGVGDVREVERLVRESLIDPLAVGQGERRDVVEA